MKLRQAWKIWKADDMTKRYATALQTIENRTRRYYRTCSRLCGWKTTMGKYYAHTAETLDLMDGILFKDNYARAGKSYHIWTRSLKTRNHAKNPF